MGEDLVARYLGPFLPTDEDDFITDPCRRYVSHVQARMLQGRGSEQRRRAAANQGVATVEKVDAVGISDRGNGHAHAGPDRKRCLGQVSCAGDRLDLYKTAAERPKRASNRHRPGHIAICAKAAVQKTADVDSVQSPRSVAGQDRSAGRRRDANVETGSANLLEEYAEPAQLPLEVVRLVHRPGGVEMRVDPFDP